MAIPSGATPPPASKGGTSAMWAGGNIPLSVLNTVVGFVLADPPDAAVTPPLDPKLLQPLLGVSEGAYRIEDVVVLIEPGLPD